MNPQIDLDEVTQLVRQYGSPTHEQVTLDVGHEFFKVWGRKSRNRRGEVLFLLPRPGGLLIHTKHEYPVDTWRLLTGGVEQGEAVLTALRREPQEEVGLDVPPERFLALVDYEFRYGDASAWWVSYVFLMAPSSEPLQPSSDEEVADTREVPPAELEDYATALESLEGDYYHDWGRFRAVVHRLIPRLLP